MGGWGEIARGRNKRDLLLQLALLGKIEAVLVQGHGGRHVGAPLGLSAPKPRHRYVTVLQIACTRKTYSIWFNIQYIHNKWRNNGVCVGEM